MLLEWNGPHQLIGFKKIFKIRLDKIYKVNSFAIWYVTLSSGLLQRVLNYAPIMKKGPPGVL